MISDWDKVKYSNANALEIHMSLQNDQNSNQANVPLQRKTTLKWRENGELSEVDMARILSRLDNSRLTACDLTCEVDDSA
tara:strand:- start:607 stop:846 length:240 start_codon:yes stop_codon:yes gene_type:complete